MAQPSGYGPHVKRLFILWVVNLLYLFAPGFKRGEGLKVVDMADIKGDAMETMADMVDIKEVM